VHETRDGSIDLEALNESVYNGEGRIPATLFEESSPFYTDIPLGQNDPDGAQKLFDELTSEGKPVTFTFLSYPTTESRRLAEALQAQHAAFDNVEARVEVVDYATATTRMGMRDFDMLISASVIQDPDIPLWMEFHGKSQGNFMGVNDAEIDSALDAGRAATSVDERRVAYEIVQKRLTELNPSLGTTAQHRRS
jgi:peptide/nickel transport system substrate-binding protein